MLLMKKKLSFKKILIPTLLLFCGYLGFQTLNESGVESSPINKNREKFNKFLDEHPYSNRNITYDEYQKFTKKDRPDLAAEQNYLMMVDPNSLTVPYQEVANAFNYTSTRLKEINQTKNIFQQKNNSKQNNGRIFFENSEDNNDFLSEAITVGGNPVVWKERGPDNVGGRSRAILWDPSDPTNRRVFAAGVTGGIWVNDNVLDPNSSWRAVNDFLASIAVNNIVADPNNPQIFYAGTGEGWFGSGSVRGIGIFKSTDAGNTWSLLSSTSGSEFSYVQKIKVTATGTILVATRGIGFRTGGIYRSTDDGMSFNEVLDGSGADIEVAANGDVYASRGIFFTGSLSKSTDDGENWVDVTPSGGSNPGRIEVAVAPTNADVVYAIASNTDAINAGSDNDTDWIQRSSDGGATWTNLPIATMNQFCGSEQQHITRGQSWYDLILAVSPTNADVVIVGGVDMARSEDGGQTWTQISRWSNDTNPCDGIPYVHADIHNIVFRPNHPSEALIGSDGGIDYSTNLSIATSPTFEARDKNYTTTQFYAVATDNIDGSDYYIGGTQDNGSLQLRSDLNLSGVEVLGGDGAFAHVDQVDRSFQLTASQFGRSAHSSNGGASFTRFATLGTGNFINQSDYDNTSGILYSTAEEDQIALVTNVKAASPNAEVAVSVNIGGRQTSAFRANANTANRLFVGTEGGRIFRIDDANLDTRTVTEITNNITAVGNVSSIDIGSSDSELVATYSNFGIPSVWYSANGGATWINKDDATHGLPNIPIRWALFNPNNTQQVLLATELGVWSTNNITAANPEWEPSNEGLANVRCDMIQYRPADGMIVVATHGRGFYTSNIFAMDDTEAPTIVSLTPADDETEALPLDANLEIQFNEPIKVGTGNINIFLASDNSLLESVAVTSNQINISGTRAIINATNNLTAQTAYYVQVDAGAFTDNFNNAFAGITDNSTWNFTTFSGDLPPVVNVPISDITTNENANDVVINLVDVFNDVDNDNSAITYSLISNSGTAIVDASLNESNLTLSFLADKIGSSEITVRADSNGQIVDDTFNVTVTSAASILFNQPGPNAGTGFLEGTYSDDVTRSTDDFIVPGGQNWDISTVTTQAFSLGDSDLNLQNVNVVIYNDNEGAPGTIAVEQTILTNQGQIIGGSQSSPSLTIRLNNVINLTSGTYWLSVHPTFNVNAFNEDDSFNALYVWFRSAADGNSHITDASGIYEALGRELLFTVDGEATITDNAPEVANPIADVDLSDIPDPNPLVLDLSSTFTDSDNDDSLITLEVVSNTNPSVVTPTVSAQQLSLNINAFGSSEITIRATSNGLTVEESFGINVLESLFSQVGNPAGTSPSQIFPDFDNASLESADDFTVEANTTWDIFSVTVAGQFSNGSAQSALFKLFNDNNGLPGDEIFISEPLPIKPLDEDGSDFSLTLNTPVTLDAGTYWISVQTVQSFNPGNNQWFWLYSEPAVNSDYAIFSPGGLAGFPTEWTSSENNGALIFILEGESKQVLSTTNFNNDELKLLANPTRGLFEVQLGTVFNSDLSVEVYDIRGRMIKNLSVNSSQSRFTVDLQDSSSGVYLMKVLGEGKSKIFKLIKE